MVEDPICPTHVVVRVVVGVKTHFRPLFMPFTGFSTTFRGFGDLGFLAGDAGVGYGMSPLLELAHFFSFLVNFRI